MVVSPIPESPETTPCEASLTNQPTKPIVPYSTQTFPINLSLKCIHNHAQKCITKSCPHLHIFFHWHRISLSLSPSLTHTHMHTHTHTHTHAQPSMLLNWLQETTLSEQYTLHFIATRDYSFWETHFALCFHTSLQHFHFVVEWSWQKPLH